MAFGLGTDLGAGKYGLGVADIYVHIHYVLVVLVYLIFGVCHFVVVVLVLGACSSGRSKHCRFSI